MKTVAAVLVQTGAPLEIQELTLPPLKKGQVLVEIHYSGLCHTQLNEIRGLKGEDKYVPHTLGHEGSGIILAIGEGVTKVKPGDHVVLSWLKGSGLEGGGSLYSEKVNSGPISTFLTKAVIAENRVIPIPPEFPLKEAALLGCAVPTGAGVIFNTMKLSKGQSLAIFGLGGVGQSALMAAKHLGAYPLIAVDIHPGKLARAKELGATHALTPEETFEPVDFAFECAGRKEAMEKAFSSIKPGGLCVLAGNLPKGQKIAIDPFELILGKRLVGTWGGESLIDRDVNRYLKLYQEEGFDFTPLVTHTVDLHELNNLVEDLAAGKVGRGLVKLK